MDTSCAFDPCDRPSYCKGYCKSHYNQHWLGKPLTPIRPYNKSGRPRRKKGEGTINREGYHRVTRDGRTVGVHRLVMEETLGRPLLPGEEVHHKKRGEARQPAREP